MKRRNRLSRSRDFDAVYRRGRSTSTRYLVLYSFPRDESVRSSDGAPTDEPRLGLAVSRHVGAAATRNRIKRRLRDAFAEACPAVAPGHDYVLVARPGLPEAAEGKGFGWLVERVAEVFERAGASAGSAPA